MNQENAVLERYSEGENQRQEPRNWCAAAGTTRPA
jgi:hypothetical protein